MDWIFDNLNIVIIIGVVIASFFKSHFDAKTQEANERDVVLEENSETPLDKDQSYRKRPPPVPANIPSPRTGPAPLDYGRPEANPGAAAAAAAEAAGILKHQQELAAHLQKLRETKATTTGGAAATRARIAISKTKSKGPASDTAAISLRARLRDPAEVRRAFVMREILDPPVALR